MIYNTLSRPCDQCPFRVSMAHGFPLSSLEEFASGAFHCHKTGTQDEETGNYIATPESLACAGALIYLEKRRRTNNLLRVMERLGVYDHWKLDRDAFDEVR